MKCVSARPDLFRLVSWLATDIVVTNLEVSIYGERHPQEDRRMDAPELRCGSCISCEDGKVRDGKERVYTSSRPLTADILGNQALLASGI